MRTRISRYKAEVLTRSVVMNVWSSACDRSSHIDYWTLNSHNVNSMFAASGWFIGRRSHIELDFCGRFTCMVCVHSSSVYHLHYYHHCVPLMVVGPSYRWPYWCCVFHRQWGILQRHTGRILSLWRYVVCILAYVCVSEFEGRESMQGQQAIY